MACILCSTLVFTGLRACLLSLAPLGHVPFVQLVLGLGGYGEVKGQPRWSLPPTMALYWGLRVEEPQWVQALLW